MPDPVPYQQIRAHFDRESIVLYQAYNEAIADAALAAGRFVEPFSTGRATKSNQTRILGVRRRV